MGWAGREAVYLNDAIDLQGYWQGTADKKRPGTWARSMQCYSDAAAESSVWLFAYTDALGGGVAGRILGGGSDGMCSSADHTGVPREVEAAGIGARP